MASSQVWENYRSHNHNKGTDEEVLSMIKDVVETIHTMERMYGTVAASFAVRSLLSEYHSLASMAQARGLNFEHP